MTDLRFAGVAAHEPAETVDWHELSADAVAARLDVDAVRGLSEEEARTRLTRTGPNRLQAEEQEPLWEEFVEALREPMVLLLLATAVLYAVLGELSDALTIFAVILAVGGIEVFNERRAARAIAALGRLAEPSFPVRRGGEFIEAPVETIVPGDLLVLQPGRRVPADARLVESFGLAADESALTGESAPVEKDAGRTLPPDTPLADRSNLVFAGTTVTRGRGAALVVATGMATELGQIAGLTRRVKPPPTPLQRTMRELTRWMVWLALGFSTLVPLLGWLRSGESLDQMILTGLSLAFATIPEELPILISVVLALGAYRLSRRHAIVKHLRAAETLSAVTVIATDKTGTLTENRMRVSRSETEGSTERLLEIGVLCNDAVERDASFAGDPVDIALLQAARDRGIDVETLRRAYPLREEFAFDNERKLMSTVYERDGGLWSVVKGAPEAVLARATAYATATGERPAGSEDEEALLAAAAEMAGDGLRVLALADRRIVGREAAQAEVESGLTAVGLVGLDDPPRPEAPAALAACRAAGIRVMVVTGDHPLTATAIARQAGLGDAPEVLTGRDLEQHSDAALADAVQRVDVFARTTPAHKLRIVQALRGQGERVAVTGDGINDAPALAAADIGIAMGETGTDVAREAADIVLADDNFATIVTAVREGRLLFANLRKAIRYYLSCKVALISATLLPVLLAAPVPFAPIQIIITELFMDLAASAAFVAEPPESDLMRRPPRDPNVPFMDRSMLSSIGLSALGLFAAVSVAYLVTWYRTDDLRTAQTIAFVTWLLGHLLLAVNLRSEREPLLRLGLFSNRLMPVWAAATVLFILVATMAPGVRSVLKTGSLSPGEWALAIGMAVVGTCWIELRKWLTDRHAPALPGQGNSRTLDL